MSISRRPWFDAEFRKNEAAFVHWQNRQESERLGIQTAGWTEKKRDVLPFIDRFCAAHNFKRRRNLWHKHLNCGLVFEVGTDLGGSPYCTQMPLKFRIFHVNEPEFAVEMSGSEPFDGLVYGSRCYRGGEASVFVLGIRANIELFDVIATSLETPLQA